MRLNEISLARRRARLAFVAKADNPLAVLGRKLSALYQRIADSAVTAQAREVGARVGDSLTEALAALRELKLGDVVQAAIPKATLTQFDEPIYAAGMKEAKPDAPLAAPDRRALDLLGWQNYFWLGEHFNDDVQQGFNTLLHQALTDGWRRSRLAEELQRHFAALRLAERDYWEGLAQHTVSKLREMGRIAGYEKAGVKAVKVKAIMDPRTSTICRCMNGRIIPLSVLIAQRERILNASGQDELKRAQPWLKHLGAAEELPEVFGLPPYHYQCRTVTVAYNPALSERGKGVQWVDGRGQLRQDTVLLSHVDEKLGRELLLTEAGLDHAGHHLSHAKIEAALRSITHKGENNGKNGKEGELVTLSQNGVVLIFRDNLVYTAYVPTRNLRDYFKDQVKQPFKKGDDVEPESND